MPIVMQSSNNGFVDARKKIIQLPDYLRPAAPKPQGLRRVMTAAATAVLPLFAWAMTPSAASADVVTLASSPAVATMNTGNTGVQGINSLTTNGVQNVKDQWFYFKLGTGAGAAQPISSLVQTSINKPASQGGTEPEGRVSVTYSGTYSPASGPSVPFTINALYQLTGGTGIASLSQTVQVNDNSTSGTSLPISIIEYNDYDLNGSAANDSVAITNGNTATQTKGGSSVIAGETNSTPAPTSFQAGLSPTLLNSITSAGFTTLNDTAATGPGDASFAFEWDTTVSTTSNFIISKTATLSNVPEPASVMTALGGLSLLMLRRRKRHAGQIQKRN